MTMIRWAPPVSRFPFAWIGRDLPVRMMVMGHMRRKVATVATLFILSYLSGNTTGYKFLKVATQLALNDLSGNINVKVSLRVVALAEKKSFFGNAGNFLTRIGANGHEFLG